MNQAPRNTYWYTGLCRQLGGFLWHDEDDQMTAEMREQIKQIQHEEDEARKRYASAIVLASSSSSNRQEEYATCLMQCRRDFDKWHHDWQADFRQADIQRRLDLLATGELELKPGDECHVCGNEWKYPNYDAATIQAAHIDKHMRIIRRIFYDDRDGLSRQRHPHHPPPTPYHKTLRVHGRCYRRLCQHRERQQLDNLRKHFPQLREHLPTLLAADSICIPEAVTRHVLLPYLTGRRRYCMVGECVILLANTSKNSV
jgi:hypothetical protein